MRELWPHQTDGIERLRGSLASGRKRPMLMAATGSGKTLLATSIVDRALQRGKRVVFTVPAISLVDQTVEAFAREGIRSVGVIQADHPATDASQPVQVASVQSLARRGFPEADLVIVDEAHIVFDVIKRWMTKRPELPFVGLSATPWTKGLGKLYDDLIIAATTQDMIDAGRLSPFRVFAPSHPDLTGVRTVAGDYHEGDLSKAMEPVTGDVVATWLERGGGLPTLCFAVDRAHAKHLRDRFEAVGVSTGYVDAMTTRLDRERLKRAFHSGEIKVVCNVGVLTTGVDWDVRCLILARPTKSEMLYTQIIGRALRTAEGKESALILDHSDTTLRLGFVTDIHHDHLDMGDGPKKADRKAAEALPKECPQCTSLRPPKVKTCEVCGFKAEHGPREVEVAQGELIELDAKRRAKENRETSWNEKQAFIAELRCYAAKGGKSDGWVSHRYKAKFGAWPNDPRIRYQPAAKSVSMQTMSWITAQNIRFAKSQKARES